MPVKIYPQLAELTKKLVTSKGTGPQGHKARLGLGANLSFKFSVS